ncbi:MAG: branched-chain amino acid transport system II carrier protein [Oscillospiraceae bacterium]|nr:branched-chain amino acid transport system II carrier protein [Oscillospiraceae bacterium]
MKLEKDKIIFVGFMLFSMFFGAGNLIFPPFLGQNAGNQTLPSVIGFLITAVILPVLAVIVVVQTGGLDAVTDRVGKKFSVIFTVLLYLAIGPGLAIPRAASVPFEMSIAPYLPQEANTLWWMIGYSVVFFILSGWLSLNPGKLVDRLGTILTPLLIVLLVFLFAVFAFKGEKSVAAAQQAYAQAPFIKGFCEGYLTMDAIAGLVFAPVVVKAFEGMNITDKKESLKYSSTAGMLAGIILAAIYLMLTYMGMQSSGVYEIGANGAVALRQIVYQLFGEFGAIILAAIFALACLTTCVGLITSVSEYFSKLTNATYKSMVWIITAFSLVVCNYGLTTILNISVPILNAIYPSVSVIIVMGMFDKYIKNPLIYPITIGATAVISVIYALEGIVPLGVISTVCSKLPLYENGFGWLSVTIIAFAVAFVLGKVKKSS